MIIESSQIFDFHFQFWNTSRSSFWPLKYEGNYYCPDGAMVKLSVCQGVSNACTGSNPTWGQFFSIFFFTASDAGKAVYVHQQHSMGHAPYVGSRLGDDYIILYTSPKSLSDIRYDIIVGIVINVCNLRFSALPHIWPIVADMYDWKWWHTVN